MALDSDTPSPTSAIAQRLGLRVTSLGPYRANLMTKGLIYSPQHGLVAFTVPGMAGFVERHRDDLD